MKEKVLQIRKALEAEIYLPALALALTLPDICGQIEYPKIIQSGNAGSSLTLNKKRTPLNRYSLFVWAKFK